MTEKREYTLHLHASSLAELRSLISEASKTLETLGENAQNIEAQEETRSAHHSSARGKLKLTIGPKPRAQSWARVGRTPVHLEVNPEGRVVWHALTLQGWELTAYTIICGRHEDEIPVSEAEFEMLVAERLSLIAERTGEALPEHLLLRPWTRAAKNEE